MELQVSIAGFDWGKFPIHISRAIDNSLNMVGQIASGKYMISPGGKGLPVNSERVTWRSGRLARSLLRRDSTEGTHLIRNESGRWIGIKGSKVPYAAIHEYGGRFIKARPFMSRTVQDPTFRQAVANIFENELRKIFKV